MTEKARREMSERLEAIPRDEERENAATGRFAGEGFDDQRLDTYFLALPISRRGSLTEVRRTNPLPSSPSRQTQVRIYDYLDAGVPLLNAMFRKRLRGYRAMGYSIAPPTVVAVAR